MFAILRSLSKFDFSRTSIFCRMRKIIVTGPESSGKTTLAEGLARQLPGLYVPEYSRPILMLTGNRYEESDLVEIAHRQLSLERAGEGLDPTWLICDTSMLVMKIWSEFMFGRVDTSIELAFVTNQVDLYVLCKPLGQWTPDPLRNDEHNRETLFGMYQNALDLSGKPYLIVEDLALEKRIKLVVEHLHG